MSFFNQIQWDDIYYRKMDGPWIPEPVVFRNQSFSQGNDPKMSASIARASKADVIDEYKGFNQVVGANQSLAATPTHPRIAVKTPVGDRPVAIEAEAHPERRVKDKAEADLQDDILAAGQMDEDLACATETETGKDDDELNADEGNEVTTAINDNSDTDVPEEPEIVLLRDSIFISGKNKAAGNVLPDWSFVDMEALAGAVQDGPFTSGSEDAAGPASTSFIPSTSAAASLSASPQIATRMPFSTPNGVPRS